MSGWLKPSQVAGQPGVHKGRVLAQVQAVETGRPRRVTKRRVMRKEWTNNAGE